MLFRVDRSLGTSCFDDCFIPGRFEIPIEPSERVRFHILAVAGKQPNTATETYLTLSRELQNLNAFVKSETDKLLAPAKSFLSQHPEVTEKNWLKSLILATDSFIVNRSSTKTKTVKVRKKQETEG